MQRKWTEKEISFLIKNFKSMTHLDIGNSLNRSLKSINQKCVKLNLKKSIRGLDPRICALRNMEYSYKYKAKERGLSFSLTNREFMLLVNNDCYYCGSSPTSRNPFLRKDGSRNGHGSTVSVKRANESTILVNGIDRLDNNSGYSIDNCVSCCKSCNEMKNDKTVPDFLTHIRKILNFQDK